MAIYEFFKNHVFIGICFMLLFYFIYLMYRRQSYIVAVVLTVIVGTFLMVCNTKLKADPKLVEAFDNFFLNQGSKAADMVESKGKPFQERGRQRANEAAKTVDW